MKRRIVDEEVDHQKIKMKRERATRRKIVEDENKSLKSKIGRGDPD